MPLFPSWAVGMEQPAGESGFRVSPDYFTVMRIPLLRGRLLTSADLTRADPVVVANEWYAEQFFPGEDAIGRHGGFNDAEIVGIVGNTTTDNGAGGCRCCTGPSGLTRRVLRRRSESGVAAAAVAARLLDHAVSAMLIGLRASDGAVMLGAAAMMLAVAVIASLVPAWRATRVDPLTAIKA